MDPLTDAKIASILHGYDYGEWVRAAPGTLIEIASCAQRDVRALVHALKQTRAALADDERAEQAAIAGCKVCTGAEDTYCDRCLIRAEGILDYQEALMKATLPQKGERDEPRE